MALEDPNMYAPPGAIYGVPDVQWPPPGFGGVDVQPVAAADATAAPTATPAIDPAAAAPASDVPPNLGEMPVEYVGAPPPAVLPPPPAAGGPGEPIDPYASPAAPAPPGPDPQLAMYGVPSSAAVPPAPNDPQYAMYGVPGPASQPAAPAEVPPPPVAETENDKIRHEAAYYASHPYDLATKDQEDERGAMEQARTSKMRADAADQRAAATNLANMTAARQAAAQTRAQAMDEASKIAAVDPERWMKASTFNTVTAVVLGALGGLGQINNGGRNIGLEQLDKVINHDIEAQQNEQQQKRANISMKLSNATANEADAEANNIDQEKFRAAVYQRAMNDIQTQAQGFAPHSSAVRALAHQYQAIAGAQQLSFDKIQEQDFNRKVKGLEVVGKYTSDMASAQKSLAEANKLEAKTGAANPSVVGEFPTLDAVPPKDRDKAFRLPMKNGVAGGWAVASSADNAKDATHYVGMYNQIDHDLNEMQRISVEREGAKSAGGSFLPGKWSTTQEQHYQQLLTDAANTYGMLIHGRAPTSGVLEEVLKNMPDLKAAWDRGDTTTLINDFRNDIDNRTTLRLSDWGANKRITSDRIKPFEHPNVNTVAAPLLADPVKGDAGYARMDVRNFDQGLDAIAQQYQEHSTGDINLGGQKGFESALDDIDAKQHKAVSAISGDIAKLQAVKKRSAQQEEQLKNNRHALADRQEAIKAIADAKKRHADVAGEAAAAALQKRRQEQSGETASPAHKRFGDF